MGGTASDGIVAVSDHPLKQEWLCVGRRGDAGSRIRQARGIGHAALPGRAQLPEKQKSVFPLPQNIKPVLPHLSRHVARYSVEDISSIESIRD